MAKKSLWEKVRIYTIAILYLMLGIGLFKIVTLLMDGLAQRFGFTIQVLGYVVLVTIIVLSLLLLGANKKTIKNRLLRFIGVR